MGQFFDSRGGGIQTQALGADPERRGDAEDLLMLRARDDVDREAAVQFFLSKGLDELYEALAERMRRQRKNGSPAGSIRDAETLTVRRRRQPPVEADEHQPGGVLLSGE